MPAPNAGLRLMLFVAGDSPRSREAAANLARVCSELALPGTHIETIDVLTQPERADEYRILTTPTVVRDGTPPRARVTGDLSDATKVLAALSLYASPPTHT